MGCRLIYGDGRVYNIGETVSGEKIYTSKTLFTGDTLENCFTEIDKQSLYMTYYSGDTQIIIFSGGTRTIEDINDL